MPYDVVTLPSIIHVFGHNNRAINAFQRSNIYDIGPLMCMPERTMSIRNISDKNITASLRHAGVARRTESDKLSSYLEGMFELVDMAPMSVLNIQMVRVYGHSVPELACLQVVSYLARFYNTLSLYDIAGMGYQGVVDAVKGVETLDEPSERSIRDLHQDLLSIRWRLEFLGFEFEVPRRTRRELHIV